MIRNGRLLNTRRFRGYIVIEGVGDNASRINTALTSFTVPFTTNYPADPVASNPVTVTNTTELNAAIVSGNDITIAAGTYTSPNFSANDLNIICESGVSISNPTFSGTRIRFTGFGNGNTTFTGTTTIPVGATNILFDHVTHDQISWGEDTTIDRVYFINCTMRTSASGGITGANGATNIAFIRCDLECTNATFWVLRMVGLTRFLLVNCRISVGAQQCRIHCTHTNGTFPTSYVFISGCQFESNGSHSVSQLSVNSANGPGDGEGLTMSFIWITDNNCYRNDTDNGHMNIGNDDTADMDNITVTGNRAFCGTSPGTPMGFINGSMTNSTVSDNITAAFDSGAPSYLYGDT